MKKSIDISVVIPLYRCAEFVRPLSERLTAVLEKMSLPYELIFVNDASPANDWAQVQLVTKEHKAIKGISLSRNFGQHKAIIAGLSAAQGKWVVVMDGDLQDQPEEIPQLYQKAKSGFKTVLAARKNRKDHFLKRLSSKLFYRIFGYLTNTKQNPEVANFGIYHNSVIHEVLRMKDGVKYFPIMVQWVGFKSATIEVKHAERGAGRSAYSPLKLIKLALNIILSFSPKPLYLTVRFGLLITITSLIAGGYYFWKYLNGEISVLGFTSLILSIWFLSGVIITIMGVLGLYIGKIFERVKDRQEFIIDESLNLGMDE